jgi:serine phosphatase RsbU (regulator of sigma subunit)
MVLTLKNQTLNQQKSEIEKQRDEIAIQKNIITEQWQEVEAVNKNLIHSINYAQRIQRAAISTIEDVRAIFPDSFVFYRPRDIVSGDFYRCGRCGKYAVMITADCTGHGIPGAFLSMLGLSGLKEYMVSEYDAQNPGIVLDKMKSFIKATLTPSQKNRNIDDGMDMTICCFDMEQMIMHYAIAAQTAYIIRNGEAIKLKGDVMPVGRYVHEKEHFQSLTLPLQKGDMIYTFSDGIQDQLGGPERRKFLQKNLTSLLSFIADKDTDDQYALLEHAIAQWQGTLPQIDDMTLVGIRV